MARLHHVELDNGIRLLFHPEPHLSGCNLGLHVNGGYQYQQPGEGGVAHMLEHLLVTQTRSYPDPNGFGRALDNHGADWNAQTGLDVASYTAHVCTEDFAWAMEKLAEAITHPAWTEIVRERERQAIAAEQASYAASPYWQSQRRSMRKMFGDHPAGADPAGTIEELAAITDEHLRGFHQRAYRPNRLVVAVGGNPGCGWSRLQESVTRHLADLAEREAGDPWLAAEHLPEWVVADTTDEIALPGSTEASITFGFESPVTPREEDRLAALTIASIVLGGRTDSILYDELRWQRGLVYGCASQAVLNAQRTTWIVGAQCEVKNLEQVEELIRDVLQQARENGIPEDRVAEVLEAKRKSERLALDDPGYLISAAMNEWVYSGAPLTGVKDGTVWDRVTPEMVSHEAEALDLERTFVWRTVPKAS